MPGFTEAGRSPVEHWIDRPIDDDGGLQLKVKVDDALAIEAVAVAEDIRDLVEKGHAEPKDVAVLVRSTTSLEPMLDALRSAGVPFEVTREREYYQRREVVETAALVRTIVDPVQKKGRRRDIRHMSEWRHRAPAVGILPRGPAYVPEAYIVIESRPVF